MIPLHLCKALWYCTYGSRVLQHYSGSIEQLKIRVLLQLTFYKEKCNICSGENNVVDDAKCTRKMDSNRYMYFYPHFAVFSDRVPLNSVEHITSIYLHTMMGSSVFWMQLFLICVLQAFEDFNFHCLQRDTMFLFNFERKRAVQLHLFLVFHLR